MFKNLSVRRLGISGTQSEIIEFALSYGFTGIDVDLVDFSQRVRTYGMEHARRYFNSATLTLSGYRLKVSLGAEEEAFAEQLAALPEMIENAVAIDCRRAIVAIEPGSDTRSFQENVELHSQRISKIVSLLEPSETQLGLELNPLAAARENAAFEFIHTLEAASGLLGTLDGYVGLVVDLWGLYASGEADAWQSLRVDQIAAVLVADAPQDKPLSELTDADRLLASESGPIDLTVALRTLEAMGYQGPVTPAPDRSSFGPARREAIAQQTGKSLSQLWKAKDERPVESAVASS